MIHTTPLCPQLLAATLGAWDRAAMHLAPRPAAVRLLEPPLRLPVMAADLRRLYLWASVLVRGLLGSGLAMTGPGIAVFVLALQGLAP
jgi:hypothetical protein